MDLTRHLYRKDEVLANLRGSLSNRNFRESIFWGLELYDSDMILDALHTLTTLWFEFVGLSSWELLTNLNTLYKSGEVDRDDFINLLISWSQLQSHDSTIFQLLLRGLLAPSDWTPQFPHKTLYTSEKDAIKDCILRGKLLEAWLIARTLESSDQWSCINEISIQKGRTSEIALLRDFQGGTDLEKLATAFIVCASKSTQIQTKLKPVSTVFYSDCMKLVEQWQAEESLKQQRVFKIRSELLHCISQRSGLSNSESTESDIQDDLELSLWASSYWKPILQEYATDDSDLTFEWKSDVYKEGFYDTYFPCVNDDIPDEWSICEREKSHGRGLGKTHSNALYHYCLRILKNTKTSFFWQPITNEMLEEASFFNWNLYTLKRDTWYTSLHQQFPLRPIIQQFTIEA